MIPRTLYSFVLLSLTAFAAAAPQTVEPGAIEVGDAVTPIAEAEVVVDEFGVEWVQVPDVEEEPVERRQEAASTSSAGGSASGPGKKCRQLEVRKEW